MELLRRYSNVPLPLKIGRLAQEIERHEWAPQPTRHIHRATQRLDQAVIDQLLMDYRAGLPSTQLATKYGLGKTTVLRLLRNHDVRVRQHALPANQVERAIQLYHDGLSLAAVGRELGCDHSTIRNVLIRAGVPRRDTQGRER